MKMPKKAVEIIIVFVWLLFLFSDRLSAQSVAIIDTLAYTQISGFTHIRPANRIRTSADGSRLIFTGNYKQIFTMNSDGSGVKQVFDYETFRPGTPPFRDPFIDISGDGTTILWTDGANERKQNAAHKYSLLGNYPNPFNPTTTISYSIQSSNLVTLKIYTVQGKEIQILVNEFQQAGRYSVDFNAGKLASGIYFYRLQVGNDFLETKKMLLAK